MSLDKQTFESHTVGRLNNAVLVGRYILPVLRQDMLSSKNSIVQPSCFDDCKTSACQSSTGVALPQTNYMVLQLQDNLHPSVTFMFVLHAAGVIAAAALKCMGGTMQGRLWPRSDEERKKAEEAGYDISKVRLTSV